MLFGNRRMGRLNLKKTGQKCFKGDDIQESRTVRASAGGGFPSVGGMCVAGGGLGRFSPSLCHVLGRFRNHYGEGRFEARKGDVQRQLGGRTKSR